MADKSKQDTIEEQLSVSRFTMQQARTLGFQLGGIVLGWFAGKSLRNSGASKTVGKWFQSNLQGAENASAEALGNYVIPWVGAAIGSTIGGIASLYEHWVKVERERLSVQEINKDVASVMASRVQFEDTLNQQHEIVKSLLAERGHAPSAQERILAEREQAATSEHARA